MSQKNVPDEVRRFVLTSIPSVPFLEALLLLRAEAPRAWDAAGVAARLYIGAGQAGELLEAMQQAGIAAHGADGSFRYAPATPELTKVIDELAATYSRDLVGVTDLIHSGTEKRAHRFADAFRWKKEGN